MITAEIFEEVKKRLIATYNPCSIYIFGSYAWGHPDEESDLDILVVIDASDEKRHRRSIPGLHALAGLGISKDLLVYTREEFDRHAADVTTLAHKVKDSGKVLYVRV